MEFRSRGILIQEAGWVMDQLTANRFRITGPAAADFNEKLKSLGRGTEIYAIWLKGNFSYIGKSKDVAGRLRQHFVQCSPKTSSILKHSQAHFQAGDEVEFAFVQVPVEVYSVIEEILIAQKTGLLNKRAS